MVQEYHQFGHKLLLSLLRISVGLCLVVCSHFSSASLRQCLQRGCGDLKLEICKEHGESEPRVATNFTIWPIAGGNLEGPKVTFMMSQKTPGRWLRCVQDRQVKSDLSRDVLNNNPLFSPYKVRTTHREREVIIFINQRASLVSTVQMGWQFLLHPKLHRGCNFRINWVLTSPPHCSPLPSWQGWQQQAPPNSCIKGYPIQGASVAVWTWFLRYERRGPFRFKPESTWLIGSYILHCRAQEVTAGSSLTLGLGMVLHTVGKGGEMLSSWRCFLLQDREILIWDPCWQLFQKGINYTRANSSLVGAPLASMCLSWGWFCCYFEGVLCAMSFFLLLLVWGSLLFFGFFGWPGLLAHVHSGSQTGSSSQRCVCLHEPLQSCCTSFWPC